MALGDEDGLAEEQRLFYVAVTRARDTLSIYTPLRMPTHPTSFHARQVLAKASRFLTDEASAVLELREAPSERSAERAPEATSRVAIPVMDELFS
jgi:DNA helicase-2/ATP-dependent DNA helicase PcrA